MLNQTLSHYFEKWCKFSNHVKAKSRKKKSHKKRATCFFVSKYVVFFYLLAYCCLTLVAEHACSALHYQSLAWDMIQFQFHPPLITGCVIVNHYNVLSSPYQFSKWPFYIKEFMFQYLSLSIQLSFPVQNCLWFCCSDSSMQPEYVVLPKTWGIWP
jgi:hypothetical protein